MSEGNLPYPHARWKEAELLCWTQQALSPPGVTRLSSFKILCFKPPFPWKMNNVLIGQNMGRKHEQGCGREQDGRSWATLVRIKHEDVYDISSTFSLKKSYKLWHEAT